MHGRLSFLILLTFRVYTVERTRTFEQKVGVLFFLFSALPHPRLLLLLLLPISFYFLSLSLAARLHRLTLQR